MNRQIGAIFFLMLFLHGLLGFSLARHYCIHSGKELYALGDRVDHFCSEESETSSCCQKTKAISYSCYETEKSANNFCSTNISNSLKDNCCADQELYYHIRDSLIKNVTEWRINVPVHYIVFASILYTLAFELCRFKTISFSSVQIPPLLASENQCVLCVFQI